MLPLSVPPRLPRSESISLMCVYQVMPKRSLTGCMRHTNRKNSKRGYDDDDDQSNKAKQVQDISVNQKSGDVYLKIDDSWVKIGFINTGNTAIVDEIGRASCREKTKRGGGFDVVEEKTCRWFSNRKNSKRGY